MRYDSGMTPLHGPHFTEMFKSLSTRIGMYYMIFAFISAHFTPKIMLFSAFLVLSQFFYFSLKIKDTFI